MKTLYVILMAGTLPMAAATISWAQCDCGAAAAGEGYAAAEYTSGCGAADYDEGCAAAPSCGCEGGGCHGGCGHCGCNKVCRLIRTEKFVTCIAYGTRCKDICLPGCTMCGHGSDGCDGGCCGGCVSCCASCCLKGAKHLAFGKGGGAKVKTVKQLVKYEVTKRICGYEWVVVEAGCCHGGCDGGCEGGCNAGCGAGDGCAVPGHDHGCGCADYGA